MTLPESLRTQVRERASFACEFCGVREVDAGGDLTVDHFQPQGRGGSDDLANLIYACPRCNQYKLDYWPTHPTDVPLWNPRREPASQHFLLMEDGTLHPLTAVGAFTLKRLRLNRPALVAYRARQRQHAEEIRLLTRYRDLIQLLQQLHRQQAALLEEQQSLLQEQQELLRLLLDK